MPAPGPWYFEMIAAGRDVAAIRDELLFGPRRRGLMTAADPHDLPLLRCRMRRAGEASATAGVEISGDPEHPANAGRLCSKGAALGDTLGREDRLLHPAHRQSARRAGTRR